MIDWSQAPEGATHWGYLNGYPYFWVVDGLKTKYLSSNRSLCTYKYSYGNKETLEFISTLTPRPKDWPTDKQRGTNGPSGEHYEQPRTNKYDRTIHGKYGTGSCTVDVYRVLNAFGPLSPEIDHAVKKLLAPGSRGHKDERQDLLEAIQSIEARLQYLEATGDVNKQ